MKALLSIAASTVLLIGCATNTNQSLKEEGLTSAWQINQPLPDVYQSYRSYAQSEIEYYTAGGGPQANSDYFPSLNEAEIWLRMVGNVFVNTTYLMVELEGSEDMTFVTCNAYNKAWLKKCGEFQSLYQSSH